eukprot:gene18476-11825_t
MVPMLIRAVRIGGIFAYMPHSGLGDECKKCWEAVHDLARWVVVEMGWALFFAADANADPLRGKTAADHALDALDRVYQLRSTTIAAGITMA